jgi:hypothetical protein
MSFEIQVCNPAIRDRSREERESLSSAMIAVFPQLTEDAYMVWNWVPVRINYNSDLSVMLEDVLLMLSAVLQSDRGSHVASFGASTFRTTWSLQWTPSTLTVEAAWSSIAGSYEDLLNSRPRLELPRTEFLGEWKSLLKKVLTVIDSSGITIEQHDQVAHLRRLEAAIPSVGRIYQGQEPGAPGDW